MRHDTVTSSEIRTTTCRIFRETRINQLLGKIILFGDIGDKVKAFLTYSRVIVVRSTKKLSMGETIQFSSCSYQATHKCISDVSIPAHVWTQEFTFRQSNRWHIPIPGHWKRSALPYIENSASVYERELLCVLFKGLLMLQDQACHNSSGSRMSSHVHLWHIPFFDMICE